MSIFRFFRKRPLTNYFYKVELIGIYDIPSVDQVNMVELIVMDKEIKDFDAKKIFQIISEKKFQFAYDETYLNESGTKRIEKTHHPNQLKSFRVLFFFDSLDINQPLFILHRSVSLTNPVEMPDRIKNIMNNILCPLIRQSQSKKDPLKFIVDITKTIPEINSEIIEIKKLLLKSNYQIYFDQEAIINVRQSLNNNFAIGINEFNFDIEHLEKQKVIISVLDQKIEVQKINMIFFLDELIKQFPTNE